VLLVLGSGCQKSTTTGQAPSTQTDQTQAQAAAKESETQAPPQAPEVVKPGAAAEVGPKIALKEAVYDFGEIGPETKHTAEFTFTSVGKAPLKIIQVKSCCGVATKGVKSGDEFAPGKSGTLELEMSTAALRGM
jgi:hypothetical protein